MRNKMDKGREIKSLVLYKVAKWTVSKNEDSWRFNAFTRPGYRKQKNMSDFWSKKWPRSFKKFKLWSLKREVLKQYSSEKQTVI